MVPEDRLHNSDIWYYNRPLGKNKLGEFLSKAANVLQQRSASSRSKVSNHSARKTAITSLLEKNVNPLHVSQLSGHKNVDSLNSYYVASNEQQQIMSDIINRKTGSGASSSQSICNSQPNNPIANSQVVVDKAMSSAFFGATITNCTFNVNYNQHFSKRGSSFKSKQCSVLHYD